MDNSEATVQKQPNQEDGRVIKLPKPNNMFSVDCTSSFDFFKWWCIMLRPFVRLTDRETDVIASFLKHRRELSKSISDDSILDTILMSDDVVNKVIEECKISRQHFYVVMSTLRTKGVIRDGIIHRKLIPNTRDWDNGVFRLLIQFNEASI